MRMAQLQAVPAARTRPVARAYAPAPLIALRPPDTPALSAAAVIAPLPRPTLGVDAEGRMLIANAAGRAALAAPGSGLALDPAGRVALSGGPAPGRALRLLLARAAAGEPGEGGLPLGLIAVPRAEAPAVHIAVHAAGVPAPPAGLVALLAVSDPEARPTAHGPMLALLREAYGLTAAEAEVALRTAEGEGLPAVAAARGIAPSTARSHLRRVFEKTGTHRQAQLARLIAQLTG